MCQGTAWCWEGESRSLEQDFLSPGFCWPCWRFRLRLRCEQQPGQPGSRRSRKASRWSPLELETLRDPGSHFRTLLKNPAPGNSETRGDPVGCHGPRGRRFRTRRVSTSGSRGPEPGDDESSPSGRCAKSPRGGSQAEPRHRENVSLREKVCRRDVPAHPVG